MGKPVNNYNGGCIHQKKKIINKKGKKLVEGCKENFTPKM